MPSSRSPSPFHNATDNRATEVSSLKRRVAALQREVDEATGVSKKKAP